MIHKDKNGVKTYIYVIMDLYGRYIIDFDFAEFKNNKPMVLKVIERCLKKEKPLISHSDGGLEVRN
ncbi:hypothetical protein FACS1894218_1620 [Bacilli bacterium]|nr:hypothetical protein FACS1894218_1620 [Bacilli bacterium]